jgi:hypothetical protein
MPMSLRSSPEVFMDIAQKQVTSFYGQYIRPELKATDVNRSGVLGMLIRHVAFGWAGGTHQVRRSISTQAIPLFDSSEIWRRGRQRARVFTDIANGVEYGELVFGDEKQLVEAAKELPLPRLR